MLFRSAWDLAFRRHPYRWPVIGYPEDLASMTVEDLRQYYKSHYQPANAVIVVVGDFDKSRIFEQIKNDNTLEKRVAGLQTPALIVWGEQDRALHVGSAVVLHKLLPRSQVITLPGVGHLPMIERDGQVAADYINFRTGLARR